MLSEFTLSCRRNQRRCVIRMVWTDLCQMASTSTTTAPDAKAKPAQKKRKKNTERMVKEKCRKTPTVIVTRGYALQQTHHRVTRKGRCHTL